MPAGVGERAGWHLCQLLPSLITAQSLFLEPAPPSYKRPLSHDKLSPTPTHAHIQPHSPNTALSEVTNKLLFDKCRVLFSVSMPLQH